jgi:hypothetical protein
VAARYGYFLRTGDEEALRAVVDHNAYDVVSMAALVGLYGEPLSTLHDEDLIGLARTLRRARALEQAQEAADQAVSRGAGIEARRVRGEIAKARGDRALALAEFEALSDAIDDASVRLELAKLYEHHVKAPLRALELCAQGTGESEELSERRRKRLEKKLARQNSSFAVLTGSDHDRQQRPKPTRKTGEAGACCPSDLELTRVGLRSPLDKTSKNSRRS